MPGERDSNLQVKQENKEQPENPILDKSNPVKFAYTYGKSGSVEQRKVTQVKEG